jgi:hypothetical protein
VENMIAALVLTPLAFVGLTGALLAGYLWFFGRSLRSEHVMSESGSNIEAGPHLRGPR